MGIVHKVSLISLTLLLLSFPRELFAVDGEGRNPIYIGLRSNLLADIILIPNLGVEFSLGNRWSLAIDGHAAWWHKHSSHYYKETYGGYVTMRKYFGKTIKGSWSSVDGQSPFRGHHLGAYVMALTYDFASGGTGYQSSRWNYGGGIEYGYTHPIAKHWNIDVSIGVGYLGGKYKKYEPMDDHYVWQNTTRRHWFGPTKLEVSLVWLIGRSNTHQKGGDQ